VPDPLKQIPPATPQKINNNKKTKTNKTRKPHPKNKTICRRARGRKKEEDFLDPSLFLPFSFLFFGFCFWLIFLFVFWLVFLFFYIDNI